MQQKIIENTYRREIDVIEFYNSEDYLHRIDGPAVMYTDGWMLHYYNGLIHRLDGPAEYKIKTPFDIDDMLTWEYDLGSNYRPGWFVNGKNISYEIYNYLTENKLSFPFNNNPKFINEEMSTFFRLLLNNYQNLYC